jgi:pimeloyl-ACP methyl ester carboxylesterase
MKRFGMIWLLGGSWVTGCTDGSKSEDGVADSGSSDVDPDTDASGDDTGAADDADDSGDPDPQDNPNEWFEPCSVDEREQRMIDVGDVSLNVACRGEGPTVVFLHGFPEFHYAWNAVMDELSAEYRLIAPDQRGYNISDKPTEVEDYALPLLTDDIVNLLPLISTEPVILVAHDWGGPVGWLVAHTPDAHIRGFLSTNGPHPLRFTELLATDSDQQEASSYMDLFRSAGAETWLTPEFIGAEMFGFLSEADLAIYTEAWTQPGAITGGLNWYRANDLETGSVDAVMAGRSPTISVPVTVMWGVDDTAVLVQNAEGLDVYADDLVVELFEGVDHWIEHRIPGEVARAIRELDARSAAAGE